jgi:FtsP/CotA-like multicopper oxidase with cupredoxin domain
MVDRRLIAAAFGTAILLAGAGRTPAMIQGLEGGTYELTAGSGYIDTPEANRVFFWGYGVGGGAPQYPGPTLIVTQGQDVEVTLNNNLSVPVSIVFPGHVVTATGGEAGLITTQAPAGGSVVYTFTAGEPGTYLYHSGTNPELQTEMGLVGALIVRPATPMRAYDHADSAYDREFLFLETEMDPVVHELVETAREDEVDLTAWFPTYWFLNGRCAPDTMLPAGTPLTPSQPYNCMVMIHPGERALLRYVNAGRQLHPFHTHGNNFDVIARDARLLSTGAGNGADLAYSDFTITVPPGGTADAIFVWTGAGLGWDMYGHAADVDNAPLVGVGGAAGPEDTDYNGNGIIDPLQDPEPGEDPDDHGKPFPVILPDNKDLTFGATYSGSPYLGAFGQLPPGEGGFNPWAGYFYMWHSHKEKEMVTNNVFPGGMMTMLVIIPPGVAIGM